MTNKEFLLFGMAFLIPNKDKLEPILQQICTKMEIADEEVINKVRRYLQCFIEYLEQINTPETVKSVIQDCAKEKNVAIPDEKK